MNFFNPRFVLSLALTLTFLIGHSSASAQNANCKVRDKDIAEIYKGGCKDGLAQGKGLAKGRDVFEGEFFEGDKIKGKYTWANGLSYDGEWKNDTMHGNGKMVAVNGDLVYQGQWLNGKRQGQTEQEKKRSAGACSMDVGAYRLKICGPDQTTNNFRCILDAQEKHAALTKSCVN